eukprot:1651732-Rhodomonas_salina.1
MDEVTWDAAGGHVGVTWDADRGHVKCCWMRSRGMPMDEVTGGDVAMVLGRLSEAARLCCSAMLQVLKASAPSS